MKVMICGGGTAGHVYPGLALAEALSQTQPGIEIVFVGSDRGLEATVVPQFGYQLETLPIKGFPRKPSLSALGFAANLSLSLAKSVRLLKKHTPSLVIGMGGFAGFPLVLVASRSSCPTMIHEQNAVPGLANRWLSRRVDLVALAYDSHSGMIGDAKAVKVVGNPIRNAVVKADRQTAVKALGLEEKAVSILIFGGSRGAQKINEAAIGAYDFLRHAHNLQVIHVTGMMEYESIKDRLVSQRHGGDKVAYHVFPYIENMGLAYAAADLVVSRAGAGTIAEITARGLPGVLIPYPHATDNHQLENAKLLESAGAAKLIMDGNMNSQLFWQSVSGFVYRPASLKRMGEKSAALGRPRAAYELANLALKLSGGAI